MEDLTIEQLISLFSQSRLNTYIRSHATADRVLHAYHMNIKLSEAMVPALHYFEILLRNGIDKIFRTYYGQNWLLAIPQSLILSEQDVQKIQKMIDRITIEKRSSPVQDDILAQMSFGFWCSFFHKRYDPILWHRKDAIKTVFPYLNKSHRTRIYIEQKVVKIKILRNRIAHLEPIWNNSKSSIFDIYKMAIELIGAMSPCAIAMLEKLDRFPAVYAEI